MPSPQRCRMTQSEKSIMRAVLRYNGIPEADHAQHIEMSREEGRGNLNRHAFRSYRIIWNSWTDGERLMYSNARQ